MEYYSVNKDFMINVLSEPKIMIIGDLNEES